MKITRSESQWLRVLTIVGVAVFGVFLVQPYLAHPYEPLADPVSLKLLVEGKTLPIPPEEKSAQFHGTNAIPPTLAFLSQITGVLGVHEFGEKHIEVDLTNQRVYAFEGGQKVYEFIVSTGKWAPTPTGEFTIWSKVRSQKMSGGSQALHTYYYLPNVPYVMFFANNDIAKARGFSLHGTYWHENFGHPMSHGCINMRIEDAHVLYDWANPPVTNTKAWSTLASAEIPGTRVIIYGTTPAE